MSYVEPLASGSVRTIIVPGAPAPWQRAGLKGKKHFTPKKSANWKKRCQAACAGAIPTSYPIGIHVNVYLPIPRSWSRWKKEAAAKWIIVPSAHRADVDNFLKAVMDALNGILYVDDRQVISASIEEFYSLRPEVVIHITPFENRAPCNVETLSQFKAWVETT